MDCSTPGLPVHHHSWSLLKLMSIQSVMPSNHFILCHPLLLLPSIFPRMWVFSNELIIHVRKHEERPTSVDYSSKMTFAYITCLCVLSVRLFATPWTVAYQASQSMGFSRQVYWSGLPFPSPGDLPGIKSVTLFSSIIKKGSAPII